MSSVNYSFRGETITGTAGCVLLIFVLAMFPIMVLLDAWALQKVLELLVAPVFTTLYDVPFVVFIGLIFFRMLFLYPVTEPLSKVERIEDPNESSNPWVRFLFAELTTIGTRLLYVLIAWIFSVIIF